MAEAFNREIKLDDQQLFAMVEEKGRMVEEGRALAKEMERLAAEHEKVNTKMTMLGAKLNKHKLNIIKRIEKVAKSYLTEYEVPVTTEIKNGVLVFTVADTMAEFKEAFTRFDRFKEAAPRKKK
jgi:hypothetical protein